MIHTNITLKEMVIMKQGNTLLESCIESFRGDYDFLSNFYVCMIEYKRVWYQSAEAAFGRNLGFSRGGRTADRVRETYLFGRNLSFSRG